MKKWKILCLTLVCGLVLGGCNSEKIDLSVEEPEYNLDKNTFIIQGRADPDETIIIKNGDDTVYEISSVASGLFLLDTDMPENEDIVYTFEHNGKAQSVKVKAKATFKAEEEAEKKAEEERLNVEVERHKAEEEAKKKAEEERHRAEEEAEKKAEEGRLKAEEERLKAEEEAEKKAEEERHKAEEEAEKTARGYDTGITYDNLARNPDTHFLDKVKFTGKIVQVTKGDDVTHFRFAIDDDYDKMLLIEISEDQLSNNRILEDDYITIKGYSIGEYTYTSTLGGQITVPGVVVDSFELH